MAKKKPPHQHAAATATAAAATATAAAAAAAVPSIKEGCSCWHDAAHQLRVQWLNMCCRVYLTTIITLGCHVLRMYSCSFAKSRMCCTSQQHNITSVVTPRLVHLHQVPEPVDYIFTDAPPYVEHGLNHQPSSTAAHGQQQHCVTPSMAY